MVERHFERSTEPGPLRWLNSGEVAARLGLKNVSRVGALIREGKLPAVLVCRNRYRVREDHLRAYQASKAAGGRARRPPADGTPS